MSTSISAEPAPAPARTGTERLASDVRGRFMIGNASVNRAGKGSR